MIDNPRNFLEKLFDVAVKAAAPDYCLAPYLPPVPDKGRLVVIGAGKAAASMARAVENHYQTPLDGLVVTRYGHDVPCKSIKVLQAAHPVPDMAGFEATQKIMGKIKNLTSDDTVLCLISGGGSALLSAPAEGLTLEHQQAVNNALLKSGADIGQMNCVRKHLSAVKGGRLAAMAHPARVIALCISDVPGDDLSVIASGPTVGDPSTCADALDIIKKYNIDVPAPVLASLQNCALETPKPGDALFKNVTNTVVAKPYLSLQAASKLAKKSGITPVILGDTIEGEARTVGQVMAAIAESAARHSHPAPAPCVILSGGETTVTVTGKGRGGRNSEFLLGFAAAMENKKEIGSRIWALSADTDGIDGSEDNAGALYTPQTLAQARKAGMTTAQKLGENDSFGFFEKTGNLVKTGPTLTNVNDFRAILVLPE